MVEEIAIIMEPIADDEEIVVTVTKEAESLNPVIVLASTTYDELREKVQWRI